MSLLHALILGIIEGLTEFLPISSTFHLLFASKLLGITQTEFSKFFDVFIQAGAILAVVVLFFKDWFKDIELLKKVAVSFVPTAIVGFVLHQVIKDVFFESERLMIASFLIVGFLFLMVESRIKKGTLNLNKSLVTLSYSQAVLIGLFQAMAVVPGVSRAGAVIVGMMVLGFRREDAAKYSFTLAVPTILAAALLDVVKMRENLSLMDSANTMALAVGFVAAFLSALIIIKWFIQFLRSNSLSVFAWYRWVVGTALLLFGFGR